MGESRRGHRRVHARDPRRPGRRQAGHRAPDRSLARAARPGCSPWLRSSGASSTSISSIEVAGDDEDAALDLLDPACAARLVEEVGGAVGRYSFVHALTREALYDSLGGARRARLHRRVAEAIESRRCRAARGSARGARLPLRGGRHRAGEGSGVRAPGRQPGARPPRPRGGGDTVRARPRAPHRPGPRPLRPAPRTGGGASPGGRRDRARSRPSPTQARSRDLSATRSGWPSPRSATSAAMCSRTPAGTSRRSRCSRRPSTRFPTTTASSGRACSRRSPSSSTSRLSSSAG